MTELPLHVVLDRVTGEVVADLGVWEDADAAVEEITEQHPTEPGRYAVRTLLDAEGLTDDTFTQAPHGPSEIPVPPVASLADGTLLTAGFATTVGTTRCTFRLPAGTTCAAQILSPDVTTTTPTGDVVVPAAAWAAWDASRCLEHADA